MATIIESIRWFKNQFRDEIETCIINKPFSLELLTAIAMQETSYIWGSMAARGVPCDEILALCTGDTLDAPNRRAFPATKADLLAAPRGEEMFVIARKALEAVGSQIAGYARVAINPDKYCHGFGIFQYDLQHFKSGETQYFIGKEWYNFSSCLQKCLGELNRALVRTFGHNKSTLTDVEMVYVAIAYNCGRADLSKDFRQGYKVGKYYYGQYIWTYLNHAYTVQ